jgi:hypothetical protein
VREFWLNIVSYNEPFGSVVADGDMKGFFKGHDVVFCRILDKNLECERWKASVEQRPVYTNVDVESIFESFFENVEIRFGEVHFLAEGDEVFFFAREEVAIDIAELCNKVFGFVFEGDRS